MVIVGFLAAGWTTGYGQSRADASRSPYLAYRIPEGVTLDRWQTLVKSASNAGVKPITTGALQREGILVVERAKDEKLSKKIDEIFSELIPVPVREYHGVLSVSSGYFYLQFQDQVPLDEVRKRLSGAGFKIITPDPAPGTVIVVGGSRLPADRERELAKLKKLPDLLYAAPHDISLPSR